ncbi:MAG: hypothetical protein KatS3mg008_0531 [Acidimicrobiales bacterium]|nr:MAG: hypothetical protein KatS3mg008_0531 [Acidimicrobiales bacterium]
MVPPVEPVELLDVLHAAADAVAEALSREVSWKGTGAKDGQHEADLVAEEAACRVLGEAGLRVVSEESGWWAATSGLLCDDAAAGAGPLGSGGASESGGLVAVVDPVDGSTNASRGVPWWSTSLCVMDEDGPLVGLVAAHPLSVRWTAVRGRGASRDGVPISVSGCDTPTEAVCAMVGLPRARTPWRQVRCLGAASVDLCMVAQGSVDVFVDYTGGTLAPWDYLAGALICVEAGGTVADLYGRELWVSDPEARRAPVAASSEVLCKAARESVRV